MSWQMIDVILKLVFDLLLLMAVILDWNLYVTHKDRNITLHKLNSELAERNAMLAKQNTLLKRKLSELTGRQLDD